MSLSDKLRNKRVEWEKSATLEEKEAAEKYYNEVRARLIAGVQQMQEEDREITCGTDEYYAVLLRVAKVSYSSIFELEQMSNLEFRKLVRAILRDRKLLILESQTSSDPLHKLTPLQQKVFLIMLTRDVVSYEDLRSAWAKDVTEDAITKLLKAIRSRLDRSKWDFSISEARYQVTWAKRI